MPDSFESYLTEKMIKFLVNRKSYCWNNGQPESMKYEKGKYTSYQVPKFMTKIVYPSTKDRDYSLTVYIHYIEYLINKKVEKENIEIKNFESYKRIYDSIVKDYKINSEVNRFYSNFLRRKEFKYEREHGKFGK